MKRNLLFIGTLALLTSCTKKDLSVSKSQSGDTKSSKMTASAANYDYTQPLSKILNDAAANSIGYAQQVIGSISNTDASFRVKKGTFAGEIITTGGLATVCWPTGGICEIIVYARNVKSSTTSLIFTGSTDAPVVGIQALPSGPVGYSASEVKITDNADEEGHISVTRQLVD